MKKTILLVDDEIDILDIQHRYLIQAGYDVLVAHDGKEGLELFRNVKSSGPMRSRSYTCASASS